MKTKNKYAEVIHHRLAELNLAQLPTQVLDHLEVELHEDFRQLVERRLTTNSIASFVSRTLRARKTATQPASDVASASLANG